jgi:hypothetical protein
MPIGLALESICFVNGTANENVLNIYIVVLTNFNLYSYKTHFIVLLSIFCLFGATAPSGPGPPHSRGF